ncbi:MAG: hypothetical protein NTW19_01360, partial [Planctomycetota bacterium]|nr:hypothetical protein [Planctomycetota bacterium]
MTDPNMQPGLSAEDNTLVCASLASMKAYLRFGAAGVGKTEAECKAAGLPSTTTDWTNIPGASDHDPMSKAWDYPQFA